MGEDRRRDRRHAGAHGDGVLSAFQLSDSGFDLCDIGRSVSRVETLRMPACRDLGPQFGGRHNVSRALIHRLTDGLAAGRGAPPGMLEPCLDPASLVRHRIALP